MNKLPCSIFTFRRVHILHDFWQTGQIYNEFSMHSITGICKKKLFSPHQEQQNLIVLLFTKS